MGNSNVQAHYPRHRAMRRVLQRFSHLAFATLTDLRITGQENLPAGGPLIVVANHFSYVDAAALVRVAPWPLEFLVGHRMPYAPVWGTWVPKLWGPLIVYRGTVSLGALRVAEATLMQGGVVGTFPEGGNWATVLRPARPGVAFLAVRTGARILPIGLDGLLDFFPSLRRGRRARVTCRIGEPFGPFHATGRGRTRRRQLDEIGDEIMRHIAALLPPERRGLYSDDAAIRAAAAEVERFPWDDAPEYL